MRLVLSSSLERMLDYIMNIGELTITLAMLHTQLRKRDVKAIVPYWIVKGVNSLLADDLS